MDTFITTYRKDFKWPFVQTMAIRSGPAYATVDLKDKSLEELKAYQESMVAPLDVNKEWCRSAPTPPLQEPVVYAAQVGAAPQSDTSKYDQPNMYLKKLYAKYPYLYNVLKMSSPDDLIQRTYKDRFRSTYQADYGKIGECPRDQYAELLQLGGMGEWADNICAKERETCRLRRIAVRPALISKTMQTKSTGGSVQKGGPPEVILFKNNKSEYNDSIGRVGAIIMKTKMHYKS